VIAAYGPNNLDLSTVSVYGDRQPIRLVVSAGALPDVAGKSVADATTALAAVDLTAKPGAQTYSDTVPDGNVIAVDQPTGTVIRPGQSVNLVISQGPEPVPVPDIGGQNWTQAKAALTAAGLNFKFNNQKSQQIANTLPNSCTVISVSPGAGTTVAKGTTVTVTLAVQNGP
jgi:beta-lactam-binding protein with PASTA domain